MDCRRPLTNFGVQQPLIRTLIDDLTGSRLLRRDLQETTAAALDEFQVIKTQVHVAE